MTRSAWPLEVLRQLERHAAAHPERTAVRYLGPCEDASPVMTYAQLHMASSCLAVDLDDRLDPNAVVLLVGPNQAELACCFFAVLKAGRTVFPLSPSLRPLELQQAARRAGATAVLAPQEVLDALAPLQLQSWELHEATRAGPASELQHMEGASMLLQSSGTTGGPKIVRRSGRALDAVASNVMQATRLKCADRVLAMVPMCHSYGVENVLLAPVLAGAEIVAVEGIERPSVSGVLESAQITVFPGFPFVFQMLLEELQGPLGHVLRLAYSAGSVLPEEFIEALGQRAGIQVGQLYGATEIGSVTFNDPADGCSADRGVGLPMSGVDIRILDIEQPSVEKPLPQGEEGHVAVHAPSMLECYVDSEVQALDNGFFLTGDLGRIDSLGNLFVTGRLKLQIDVGGAKVNPLEVEAVLRQVDGVQDCVVVSMPVNATLNRLRALVECDAASKRPTSSMLRSHVRSRLAAYKVPRIIEFCDQLPRSSMGKILRQEIQEQPA